MIATPEVASEKVAATDLEFVVLATDGLWDVVDDQVLEMCIQRGNVVEGKC